MTLTNYIDVSRNNKMTDNCTSYGIGIYCRYEESCSQIRLSHPEEYIILHYWRKVLGMQRNLQSWFPLYAEDRIW
jgi:hypothetical protein